MEEDIFNVKRYNKEFIGKLFYIFSFLFFGFMVYLIITKPFVFNDDWFTVGLTYLPLFDSIKITAADVHPPLYYIIIKFVTFILTSLNIKYNTIFLLKLLSAVPYLLILIVSGIKLKNEYDWLTIGLFTILIAIMSNFLLMYVSIRMYTYSVLFLLLSFYYLNDVIKESSTKSWVLFTLFTLLGAYTHYYTAISSSLLYFCLLGYYLFNKNLKFNNKTEIKKWFVSVLSLIVLYLPWISVLLSQFSRVSDSYWIPPIDINSIMHIFSYFAVDTGDFFVQVSCLCVLAILMICVFSNLNKMNDMEKFYILTGLSVFFGSFFIGFILSYVFQPMLYDRYLLPAIGLLWLIFSISISRLYDSNKKIFVMISCLLLVLGSVSLIDTIDTINRYDHYTDTTMELINNFDNDTIVIYSIEHEFIRFHEQLKGTNEFLVPNKNRLFNPNDYNLSVMPIDKIVNENPHKDIYLILRIQKSNENFGEGIKVNKSAYIGPSFVKLEKIN